MIPIAEIRDALRAVLCLDADYGSPAPHPHYLCAGIIACPVVAPVIRCPAYGDIYQDGKRWCSMHAPYYVEAIERFEEEWTAAVNESLRQHLKHQLDALQEKGIGGRVLTPEEFPTLVLVERGWLSRLFVTGWDTN